MNHKHTLLLNFFKQIPCLKGFLLIMAGVCYLFPFPAVSSLSIDNYSLLSWSNFISACLLLGMGILCGIQYQRKKALRQLYATGLSKKSFGTNIKAKGLEESLNLIHHHLHVKEASQRNRDALIQGLSERYHYMASQALAIVNVSSTFIHESKEAVKDLSQLMRESPVPLRQMVQGYPMPADYEKVHIGQSIEAVKAIFMPEILKHAIQLEVQGDLEQSFYTDKVIFEIVLHNFLQLAIHRIYKNGVIKIEVKLGHQLEMTFQDNGYDFERCFPKAFSFS